LLDICLQVLRLKRSMVQLTVLQSVSVVTQACVVIYLITNRSGNESGSRRYKHCK